MALAAANQSEGAGGMPPEAASTVTPEGTEHLREHATELGLSASSDHADAPSFVCVRLNADAVLVLSADIPDVLYLLAQPQEVAE